MDVLIIEDEALAAERLQEMLLSIDPGINVLTKLSSVKESARWLMQNNADLIFLDIQLSDGSAFNIFDQVDVRSPVIFTTAYDQYAIKAFEVNSIAYLLKPLRTRDLENSLGKYHSMESAFQVNIEELMSTILDKKQHYKSRFLIRIGDIYKKVQARDIAYFYAMEKSVFIKTRDGKTLPIDYSLDALEDMLDPGSFFRINRAYMDNIAAIKSMEAWSRGRIMLVLEPNVKVDSDTIVSISRSADFKDWVDQ
jgi:DNA-binding LytR/AlgR family response regulator